MRIQIEIGIAIEIETDDIYSAFDPDPVSDVERSRSKAEGRKRLNTVRYQIDFDPSSSYLPASFFHLIFTPQSTL